MKYLKVIFALGLSILIAGCSQATTTEESEVNPKNLLLDSGAYVSYYSNFSFNNTDLTVTRAIIVIHGTNRDADEYYDAMLAAATLVNEQENTFIVAVHFKSVDDVAQSNQLQWSSSGWKSGNLSVEKTGLTRLSSFAVIDQVMNKLFDRTHFPALTDIVLTGHSAGGQFTQRYAVGTQVDIGMTEYSFNFVVANPGSYLYLNANRIDNSLAFSIPNTTCIIYDDYKYGLINRNSYMSTLTETQLSDNYIIRNVTYLLGEEDTIIDENLDTGCEANLQGETRYGRGQNFMNYITSIDANSNHVEVDVPGIGHSKNGMFKSTQGLGVLFQ